MLENVLNVQKTFNAETVRFINEYIGIEDPESQHVFLQERKLLNDRLEAFLRVLERRYQSSELKIHREVKNLAELVYTFFSLFEQRWDDHLPPFKTEITAPRRKIEDIEYTFFEDLWRGDLQDVKKKQRVYLKYFKDKNNVLDFGCGRGEFLELLAEEGVSAFGVEENEEMISLCKEKELNVVCQNGMVYLHRISDHSLGGVFVSHVIEHLSYEEIMKLLNLCSRKLEIGGVIVIETINPCNYKAYFDNFIKDFTHKTPIHLDTLKFVLELNGFKIKEVLELSELAPEEKLKKLDPDSRGMDEKNVALYNGNIERLNMLLFGNQDYAVIAST
jgi:O-antigen chain-terminating methyltransferase